MFVSGHPVNYSCSSHSEVWEGAQAAVETAHSLTGSCSLEQTSGDERSLFPSHATLSPSAHLTDVQGSALCSSLAYFFFSASSILAQSPLLLDF